MVTLRENMTFLQGPRYTRRVVDRIGGGDSFAAGLIHGFVSGRDLEATWNFEVAASALKQTIPGDFKQVSVAEVERLVAGMPAGACRDRQLAGLGAVCLFWR